MLLATFIVAGCGDTPRIPESADDPAERFATFEGSYRIGVDDRVQIAVWRNPELSVTAPVRPDGKISVPIIGDVEVGGRTPSEVSEIIKKRLSEYIRDPNVAVILTELRSHEFLSRVRVTGAVRTPRSMPHRQGMTVLDAVLEAGGVNDFASPNRTKLYRKVKDKTDVLEVDLGDILKKGRLETNYPLKPGDVVTVPERLF
jgi:polysaccharide biosynthesis/export protein